jgi:hypothetical protein
MKERALLPRVVIREDVTPDRVSVETEPINGIMIDAGRGRESLSRTDSRPRFQ